jgi:hypothetical protein
MRQAVPMPGWQRSIVEGANARVGRKAGIGEVAGRSMVSTQTVGCATGETEAGTMGNCLPTQRATANVGRCIGC